MCKRVNTSSELGCSSRLPSRSLKQSRAQHVISKEQFNELGETLGRLRRKPFAEARVAHSVKQASDRAEACGKEQEKAHRDEWRNKVKDGFEKGNRFGHQITKPRPETVVVAVRSDKGEETTAVDETFSRFHCDIWKAGRDEPQPNSRWRLERVTEVIVEEVTGDDVQGAASKFETQTARPCGMHPRHFGSFPQPS